MTAHERGDYFIAYPIVLGNAWLGSSYAASLLGTMYLFGEGVRADGHEAEYWLAKAAHDGLVDAQSLLGIMYATGRGVPKDHRKANAWLTKAASAGDKEALQVLRTLNARRRM